MLLGLCLGHSWKKDWEATPAKMRSQAKSDAKIRSVELPEDDKQKNME
jgi:hypothetical protein